MSLFSAGSFPDLAYNFDIRQGHFPGRDYSTIELNLAPVTGYTPAEGDIVCVVNTGGVPQWQKKASASLELADVTTAIATIEAINTTGELDADGEVAALTGAIGTALGGLVEALLRMNGQAADEADNFGELWTIVRGMQAGEYDGIGADRATGIRGTYVVETNRLAAAIAGYTIGDRVVINSSNLLALPTAGEAAQVYGVIICKTANTVEVLVGG